MKSRLSLLLALVAFLPFPLAKAGEPLPKREAILQAALDEILAQKPLRRLRVGIRVDDLVTGRVLYEKRGQAMMDPASNQKILATTSALLRLGADYRFRTEITGSAPSGDGMILGDLVLRGSGDPSLRQGHLDAMVRELSRRGVSVVMGDVLADPRRIGSNAPETNFSPLQMGGATIAISVRPGEKNGSRGVVHVRPESEVFVVANSTETRAKGRGRLSVTLAQDQGKIRIKVSGTISQKRGELVIGRPPPHPTLYAAILLRQSLLRAGIEVRGQAGLVAEGSPTRTSSIPRIAGVRLASASDKLPLLQDETQRPPESRLLALHESAPLSLLIRRVNKASDNRWAERVLEHVGAEIFGGPATPAKGLRVLDEVMSELGIPRERYISTNGSGLGHRNRIGAATLVDVLKKLYLDPRIGPEFMQSLSVGGIDGTTRNRFQGTPAAQRVRAKTGTLNGVSCLSGFVGESSDKVAFAILVEGHRRRQVSAVRAAQVSAVNAMLRYANQSGSASPDGLPAPGIDYETGDGELSTEAEGGSARF